MTNFDKISTSTLSFEKDQVHAIRYAINLGFKIQKDFPEIADDYRNKHSASAIVAKYSLDTFYGVKTILAEKAVNRALRGYDGHLKVGKLETYPGLIEAEEMKALGVEHQQENRSRMGNTVVKEGKGIFALSVERRREIARERGAQTLAAKTGIHAMTFEERVEHGRRNALLRGQKPYTDQEIDLVAKLMEDPKYKKGSILDIKKITAELNERLHKNSPDNYRTTKQIKKIYVKVKRAEKAKMATTEIPTI